MLSAIWNFLVKWAFFSGVYVQLFHYNGNEKNIFIAIKVKLPNPHRSLIKMFILEENFKRHLEAFAYIAIYIKQLLLIL